MQSIPEVKVCKFIENTDIVVSADLDGYINFYARPPSIRARNGPLLLRIIKYNENERYPSSSNTLEKVAFPTRAMDYDPEEQCLYTGDEMGYMYKWDISSLIYRLQTI